jgi:hypothetical protein
MSEVVYCSPQNKFVWWCLSCSLMYAMDMCAFRKVCMTRPCFQPLVPSLGVWAYLHLALAGVTYTCFDCWSFDFEWTWCGPEARCWNGTLMPIFFFFLLTKVTPSYFHMMWTNTTLGTQVLSLTDGWTLPNYLEKVDQKCVTFSQFFFVAGCMLK